MARHKRRAVLVAMDSEWDATADPADPWISTAFASDAGTVVFVRDDIPPRTRRALQAEARALRAEVKFVNRKDSTSLLQMGGWGGQVDLALFFTPKDIEYAIGWDAFSIAIECDEVRRGKALTGLINKAVKPRDVSGWAGKQSLVNFAKALGVQMPAKTTMEDYKAEMRRGLLERPREYLRYAVSDARVLLTIIDRFVDFVGGIMRETLRMPAHTIRDRHTIPMTVGRLVAATFEKWLVGRTCQPDLFNSCIHKLGFLYEDLNSPKVLDSWRILSERCRTPEAFAEARSDPKLKDDWKIIDNANYEFTPISGAAVKWWASRATTETAGCHALVHGGRCHNERPDECSIGPGLDSDISGCYGARALSKVT